MSQYPNDPPPMPEAPQPPHVQPHQPYPYAPAPAHPSAHGYYPLGYPGYLPQRHSGLGIASFIIAIAVGVLDIALIITAGVMAMRAGGEVNEESAEAMALGCTLFLGGVASLVGMILGIIALTQRDRRKILAILGVVFNAGILLVLGLLIVVGMTMQ